VDVAGVAAAFAGGDEGIFCGVFVVEAHVAYGRVSGILFFLSFNAIIRVV